MYLFGILYKLYFLVLLAPRNSLSIKKIIISFLFCLYIGYGSNALARQAILINSSGSVEIQDQASGLWKKANKKQILKQGEKIRTGKSSKATLIFDDGSKTMLSQDTVLLLSQLIAPIQLSQETGTTRNKVKKTGKGFMLQTQTAVCSVRGTDFSVGVGEGGTTQLDVFEGIVNGLKLATGESKDVAEGESLVFTENPTPLGTPQPIEPSGDESSIKQLARKEVGLDMTREEFQAAVAEEMKLAEYQEGKSLIDVNGLRVRIEEYILRKPKDVTETDREKAFKFVVLNLRETRIDFFTYKGIFNKKLPEDLSIALRNVTGRHIGQEPEYYLRSYEMTQSNFTDAIKDMADGGHLVEVRYNADGSFTLIPHTVNADGAAGPIAGGDSNTTITPNSNGLVSGKVYDPIADLYKQEGASLDGIYDSTNDTFRLLKKGETLWRTVFNRYAHLLGPSKDLASLTLDNIPAGTLTKPWFQTYTPKTGVTNIASLDQTASLTTDGTVSSRGKTLTLYTDQNIGDGSYKYLNGHYAFDSYFPDASNPDSPTLSDKLHQRLITYYPNSSNTSDIPYEQYDTYIISDEGKIAKISAFANVTSGKAFKEELIKWNYQQITKSSAYGDRTIDIVVEPKILIRSGLIK